MSPMFPHFASECLEELGEKKQIFWPKLDKKYLEKKELKIVFQVNGKKRGIINTKKDINERDLMKTIYGDEKITKYFDKNKIKKKIYIKNKLVNIIA